MRLLINSDLHLEFGPFEFPTGLPGFDVAVFAGDIHQPVSAAIECWRANGAPERCKVAGGLCHR
jgi:hypothetical protein